MSSLLGPAIVVLSECFQAADARRVVLLLQALGVADNFPLSLMFFSSEQRVAQKSLLGRLRECAEIAMQDEPPPPLPTPTSTEAQTTSANAEIAVPVSVTPRSNFLQVLKEVNVLYQQ